ncbi:hypothetical protein [Bacteroides sp.]|uniref:hypothetical protein n=1 Tax=Bacteroides sp. TaxID=29523 RepID=UPI003AB20578
MKNKYLSFLGGCLLATVSMTSCLDASVDNDSLGGMVPAEEIAANLDVHGITPGSNKVVIKNNNMGVGGMWDYLVGVTTAQCDTVLIPFLGEQTLKFYATCGGGQVIVEKKVTIDVIDFPLDPSWAILAGEGEEGKTWVWDPNPGRGSWGCYGAGGYGWSADVPNWGCTAIGGTSDAGVAVSDKEYITFDLNGGANATLHKADGTVVKGSFSFSMGASADKAALKPSFRDGTPTGQGWVGTLTLKGVSLPSGFNYYSGAASGGTYDIAVFSENEMVLIEPDAGAVLCDPNWSSVSTHWCFVAKE